MCESSEDVITVGSYVIVQRQNYKKMYKVTVNGTLMLRRDVIEMTEIIGKRFWTTFEMIPAKNGKRSFSLKEAPEAETWNDLLTALPSGRDNRSINDDGTSQKLSKEEILQLQESGKTGKEIVGSLIENNKSFLVKTEYSQEKYLKKKENKYFRFLTICKPNINTLHDVYFKLDRSKIGHMRMDALAQILSYCDVQSEGLYLLYDSGSQGLPASAMLNRIGATTNGHLINLHPGNVPQTTIVQAMNFPKEQLDRLINVNIYSFLRLHYQGASAVLQNVNASKKAHSSVRIKTERNQRPGKEDCVNGENLPDKETKKEFLEDENILERVGESNKALESNNIDDCTRALKRKLDESKESVPPKKPKWLLETERGVDLIQSSKARGLVIVAKEHPSNIASALLPFLGVSRPFVIFHNYREPLQETYMMLKQKQNVINLKLFTNFLRSYQVLPDRTHPDIVTSDTGGYILTGYLVE